VCPEGHFTSIPSPRFHIIALEKVGRRKTDTIQSVSFQAAGKSVKDYLAAALQKGPYDICAVAYNGVVIRDDTMEKAFVCRMYGAGLGDNCFVLQTFRPGSSTAPNKRHVRFLWHNNARLGNVMPCTIHPDFIFHGRALKIRWHADT